MVVINNTGEEVNVKLVYYGPGLSGKTTNLEYVYGQAPASSKGQLISMKTRTDRTLYFDYFPLEAGEINGRRTRLLLYTVPGQVFYNATRKLVLKGVDAIVFVADSAPDKLHENVESLRNLEDNLNEHNLSLDDIPWVIQYNKRDLPDAMPVEELHRHLNLLNVPGYEAVATRGHGVNETLRGVTDMLYGRLDGQYRPAETSIANEPERTPIRDDSESAEDVEGVVDFALREVSHLADTPVDAGTSQPRHVAEPPKVRTVQPGPAAQPGGRPRATNIPGRPEPAPVGMRTPTVSASDHAEERPVGPNVARKVNPRPAVPVSPVPSSSPRGDRTPEPPAKTAPVRNTSTEPTRSLRAVTAPERKSAPASQKVADPSTEKMRPDTADNASPGGGSTDPFSFRTADSEISEDMGRTLELDEMFDAPDAAVGEKEFIVGPLQSGTSKSIDDETDITRDVMPTVAPAETDAGVQEIKVPVVISRSQVQKSIPLKLRLEIHVADD